MGKSLMLDSEHYINVLTQEGEALANLGDDKPLLGIDAGFWMDGSSMQHKGETLTNGNGLELAHCRAKIVYKVVGVGGPNSVPVTGYTCNKEGDRCPFFLPWPLYDGIPSELETHRPAEMVGDDVAFADLIYNYGLIGEAILIVDNPRSYLFVHIFMMCKAKETAKVVEEMIAKSGLNGEIYR